MKPLFTLCLFLVTLSIPLLNKAQTKACALTGTVIDAQEETPLEGVVLAITYNNQIKATTRVKTDSTGVFLIQDSNFCLGKTIDVHIVFNLTVDSIKYFPKEIDFKYKIKSNAPVKLNNFMKLTMQKKMDKYFFSLSGCWEEIEFKRNSARITKSTALALNNLAECQKKLAYPTMQFAGHASCSEKNPVQLSKKRVNAVINYLIKQGTPDSTLCATWYGKTKKLTNCTETCTAKHPKSRRVEHRFVEEEDFDQFCKEEQNK